LCRVSHAEWQLCGIEYQIFLSLSAGRWFLSMLVVFENIDRRDDSGIRRTWRRIRETLDDKKFEDVPGQTESHLELVAGGTATTIQPLARSFCFVVFHFQSAILSSRHKVGVQQIFDLPAGLCRSELNGSKNVVADKLTLS
jgi:hypothetical protein